MMDEKRKILELLEKGLITTDEALELLAALEGAHETFGKGEPGGVEPKIPVEEEGDGSLFRLDVNVTASDLTFALGDGEKVQVAIDGKGAERFEVDEGPGYLRLYERRETAWPWLFSPSFSGSPRVAITLPRGLRFRGQVRTVSGDIRGELPLGKDLLLRTVSGDVDLTGSLAALEVHSVSGDLRWRVKRLFSGDMSLAFHTVSGDVRLFLPPGAYGIRGQGSAVSGGVELELPGVETAKHGVTYRLKRSGEPLVDLKFRTVSGDVVIREGVV